MYFYHGDHLGSAQLVTDIRGNIYEHLEYTPYGELWIDHAVNIANGNPTMFRFTGKERDPETGLYYYGARYLDPRTSRWISADPAMWEGDYIPSAPINDQARERNQNLPGIGGIFNYVNFHVYHYAGNNPVSLTDPDGRQLVEHTRAFIRSLVANPKFVAVTQQGLYPELFYAAGFMQGSRPGIYHARQDCWQRFFGYNMAYDFAFNLGTNMNVSRFNFSVGDQEFAIWAWKGDYLNLGAGAELGIYTRFAPGGVETPHWLVDTSLAMPMTLTLTDSNGNIILNYNPREKQWWVTGFNSHIQNVNPEDLIARFTIDFSNNRSMYNSLRNRYAADNRWTFNNETYTATFTF